MTDPRASALVDLDAVAANTAEVRRRNPGAQVMAVVKADGYGHGAVPVARAALAAGATWLGVATVPEALALRAAGLDAPLLAWLLLPGDDLDAAVAAGVELSASTPATVAAVAAAARRTGRTAALQLEADTGMTRGGARPGAGWEDLVAAAAAAQADGALRLTGTWSHLVEDEPHHPTTDAQAAALRDAVAAVRRAGLDPGLVHLAKSTAALARPDLGLDLVRAGIATYGLSPVPGRSPRDLGLRPAMTLRAAVALTHRVPAGTGVSYGRRWAAERETTLALVPVGYADGVPRAGGPDRLEVLLGGQRRRVAGTVCMDQFLVEVGDDPVEVGDEVVLLGPGDRGEPTAEEWARVLGTIDYEVVTRIGARVPREHTGALAARLGLAPAAGEAA